MRVQYVVLLGMVALVAAMLGRMGLIGGSAVVLVGLLCFGLLAVALFIGLVIGVPVFLLISGLMALVEWIAGPKDDHPNPPADQLQEAQ